MCYFNRCEIKQVHQLEYKDAIIAYKYMRITKSGDFQSPVMKYITWFRRRLSAVRPPHPNSPVGIYAFRSKSGAKLESHVYPVVKVKLWGTVIEHKGRSRRYTYDKNARPGYRAQHAEIIEIVWCDKWYDRAVKTALKRYRALVDGRES